MESPKTAILADDSCNAFTREQEKFMRSHRLSALSRSLRRKSAESFLIWRAK